MVAPSNTYPFFEIHQKFFPDGSDFAGFPAALDPALSDFDKAHKNLEDCFNECELKYVVTLFKSLLPLNYAQLEAIDKTRCNIFRGKSRELEDLEQRVNNSALMPWHQKYKWSLSVVATGAILGIVWFCLSPSIARSLAGTASVSALLGGAYYTKVIRDEEKFISSTLACTRSNFTVITDMNKCVVTVIELNQQDRPRTITIPVISTEKKVIGPSEPSEVNSPSQREVPFYEGVTGQENLEPAGSSSHTLASNDLSSIFSADEELESESDSSAMRNLKRKMAEVRRQAQHEIYRL